MQRREEDGRIDVALVIRAVDGGPVERQAVSAVHAVTDARQRETQSHTAVAENVEEALPLKQDGHEHPQRSGDQNVEGNGEISETRSEGGNQHAVALSLQLSAIS